MNLIVFFFVLIILKMICFFASWFTMKRTYSKEDYYLAGRSISFFPLTMTLIGIVLGGGSVFGSAEEAFKFGWSFLLYPSGFCAGFILFGLGAGKRLHQLKIFTIAQIFEKIYGSRSLKKIASFLSIISLYLILVVQIVASKKFLFAFGIENPVILFTLWSCVFLYTVIGGFKAVVISHVIQTVFFIMILFSSFYFVVSNNPTIIFESLLVGFTKSPDLKMSKIFGWLLLPSFFFLISQDIGQRCFAAKSSKIVVASSITAGVCLLFVMAIPIFFGNIATVLNIIPKEGGSIFMTILSWTTNPIVTALVGSGFVAAVTSSAESLINAISSNVLNDFNLCEGSLKKFGAAKWTSWIIAFSSLGIAWVCNSIIDVVIISYELLICTLFVSVFISFFVEIGNKTSALYSIFTGGALLLYFHIIPKNPPVGFQLICLVSSLLAFYLGELQIKFKKIRKSS